MSIVKQIKENNLTDATASIHEALAEIRQHKLMEFKKQIAKERFGGLDEASYGGSRNSFTRHEPVRGDPDKVMAAAKERQEMQAKEAAEKKRRFLEAKKKANEVKEATIQEVSKALLSRYRGKADDQVDRERFRGNKDKVMKRTMGIGKANQKLEPDGKAKIKATD